MNSAELEAAIMNRLQEKKQGQTPQQLSEHLKKSQGEILTVLHILKKEKCVTCEKDVWTMLVVM